MSADFSYLKPGDKVTRLLGNTVTMHMIVTEVTDDIITCNCVDDMILTKHVRDTLIKLGTSADRMPALGTVIGPVDGELWTFDRKTGMEIDDMLRWGPKHHRTGSYLMSHETWPYET